MNRIRTVNEYHPRLKFKRQPFHGPRPWLHSAAALRLNTGMSVVSEVQSKPIVFSPGFLGAPTDARSLKQTKRLLECGVRGRKPLCSFSAVSASRLLEEKKCMTIPLSPPIT